MNTPRFRRAIEIIEAIPDFQLNLREWQRSTDHIGGYIISSEQATCGTIACAAGWLALHPDMQAQGLTSGYCGQPHVRGETCGVSFRALELFFDIPDIDAYFLFGSRVGWEESGDMANLTDKQVWLNRARTVLSAYEGTV